jgi:predicted RNA-binding Zn-ribbon protein involved in translation (DUF1610 family)
MLRTRTVKRIEIGETERHLQAQAECPECGVWGDVDSDQLRGEVSLICPECGWHGSVEHDERRK